MAPKSGRFTEFSGADCGESGAVSGVFWIRSAWPERCGTVCFWDWFQDLVSSSLLLYPEDEGSEARDKDKEAGKEEDFKGRDERGEETSRRQGFS